MGETSPGGVPEQVFDGDRRGTDEEAGREADIEDEDFVVVCGATSLVISGFESGYYFLRDCPKNRLCVRVLLTPLDLHNVNFQIFKIYN